jgi:hypothetical protein
MLGETSPFQRAVFFTPPPFFSEVSSSQSLTTAAFVNINNSGAEEEAEIGDHHGDNDDSVQPYARALYHFR